MTSILAQRPAWRPFLGQIPFPQGDPSREEVFARLTSALANLLRPYSTIPFEPTTHDRLTQEISRCEALTARMFTAADVPSAQADAEACFENLRGSLKQAADAHFAARQAAADSSLTTETTVIGLLATASSAASAYHGYKRNNSTGWAIWWGLMGALFPVITPAVAIAQGFGKRAR